MPGEALVRRYRRTTMALIWIMLVGAMIVGPVLGQVVSAWLVIPSLTLIAAGTYLWSTLRMVDGHAPIHFGE